MTRAEDPALRSAVGKAAARLLPFLLLLYILAFLDRVNVGYAKQALLRDTGLGEGVYAFGASVFFVGYAIFEVPSNLIMHRVGARLWMCRIMVTWGLVSAAMMFATNTTTFYVLRFLLGVAEAGFFPGVILYLTYWFPAQSRGPMMGLFYFGAPIAQIFGGPLSGLLLELDGTANLRGWQWMFLVEGLMAAVVGVWTYFYLTDRPATAGWLTEKERSAIQAALDAEENAKNRHDTRDIFHLLSQPRVLYFGLIYCLIQMSVYGVTFYLPSQVARLLGRETGFVVGCVSAIPWICALLAAFLLPRLLTRYGRAHLIASIALILSAVGIAISASGSTALALAALSLAAAGFIGAQPVFWTLPTAEFAGIHAAAVIALINSFGALGGFFAPNLKVMTESLFSSISAGQFALAASSLVAGTLLLGIDTKTRTT